MENEKHREKLRRRREREKAKRASETAEQCEESRQKGEKQISDKEMLKLLMYIHVGLHVLNHIQYISTTPMHCCIMNTMVACI